MVNLSLNNLSFLELFECYCLLTERRSQDTDEIHQYLIQMLKVGTSNELSMLGKYSLLDDSSRAEVTEAMKNRQ